MLNSLYYLTITWWKWKLLSCIRLCGSREFSRPEYWSGSLSLLLPTQGFSSQLRDQTQVSRIAGRFFTSWATRDAQRQLFSSVQFSCSVVSNSVTPWIAARQACLSITNSQSSLKLSSIESMMPSSHLILCRPLLLLPPIPPSISLFQWVNSSHEVAKVLEFQF